MARWTNENAWDVIIRDAASRYNVPVALIKAIIAQESGYKASAYRKEPAVNDASIGLMQILLATAKGEGYSGAAGDATKLSGLFDPATNINYGTAYLESRLNATKGNVAAAISAYNGGYRPELGFGAKATKELTICLARDQQTGKCITTRVVKPGEYANQPYVNAVLNNMAYFESQLKVVPTVIPSTTLPLASAYHNSSNESETGRRTDSVVTRTPRNNSTETPSIFIRIVEWFKRLLLPNL